MIGGRLVWLLTKANCYEQPRELLNNVFDVVYVRISKLDSVYLASS